ncbi:MAG: proton-conducting transporter transmembrane domain-containing protein [Thermoplasmata archaeon]
MNLGESVLLLGAITALFGGAPAALMSRRLGYAVCFSGSLLFVAAGVAALTFGPFSAASWTGAIGEAEGLRMDALSGFFALTAGIVWAATSVYSIGYDRDHGPSLAVAYSLTIGAIAVLLCATNWILFLAAWETMTLAAYWMILEAVGRPIRIFSAAFVFLAFGEASTLLVAVAVGGLFAGSGSFAMAVIGPTDPIASLVFVAALVGFGLKMGVAPFHMSEWLPIAHASAPSNASAVLSATLTLAGVYGLFRVLSLLKTGPAWWGALLLAIGAVSALLGAIFASVSEHTKGLPAYSTIENNGLILVALGIGLMAESDGIRALAAFAFFAALFQALAHAVTKATLFLFAGEVERSARTFDLSRALGGVSEADPLGSGAAVIAALSLAAAPPLAGFVSEWMILESLFQSFRFSQPALVFLGLLAGATVALAAGLILVAMIKFVGFTALWKPVRPTEAVPTPGLRGPIAALTAVVVALGVLSPWILVFVAPTASVLLGGPPATAPVGSLLALPHGWAIVSGSLGSPFGAITPPALPIALAVGVLPALAYYGLRPKGPRRRVPAWAGGRAPLAVTETYTAFGYSTGLRIMLGGILGTREIRRTSGPVFRAEIASPEPYDVELEVLDVFKPFYDALVRAVRSISDGMKQLIMPGHVGRYLAYLLGVLFIVLIYVALAFGAA